MTDWYLVYCKARQEDAAARGLEEQGYDVYLPKLKAGQRRSRGIVEVIQPLFPRYLFVSVGDKEQSISPVRYTAGVSKLVRFSAHYDSVPQGLIEELRAREDPETGFHQLTAPNLKKGDRVRIQAGVFAGIDGVFEARSGQDRVIVLLEILGQQARTEIAIEELEH